MLQTCVHLIADLEIEQNLKYFSLFNMSLLLVILNISESANFLVI